MTIHNLEKVREIKMSTGEIFSRPIIIEGLNDKAVPHIVIKAKKYENGRIYLNKKYIAVIETEGR